MGSIAEITQEDMVKVKRYISDIHGPQTAVADLAWQGGEGAPSTDRKKLQRPEWSLLRGRATDADVSLVHFFQKRERKMLPKRR